MLGRVGRGMERRGGGEGGDSLWMERGSKTGYDMTFGG